MPLGMSEDLKHQSTSQAAETEPHVNCCEPCDDIIQKMESNDVGNSEDPNKFVADYITADARDLDDDKHDRSEGRHQPVKADEVNDRQDTSAVAEQFPTPEAHKQTKKEIPDEVKLIAMDLHTKGKSPKQVAAHYSVADYGLTEGDVANIIQEQKGRIEVSGFQISCQDGVSE